MASKALCLRVKTSTPRSFQAGLKADAEADVCGGVHDFGSGVAPVAGDVATIGDEAHVFGELFDFRSVNISVTIGVEIIKVDCDGGGLFLFRLLCGSFLEFLFGDRSVAIQIAFPLKVIAKSRKGFFAGDFAVVILVFGGEGNIDGTMDFPGFERDQCCEDEKIEEDFFHKMI